MSTWAARKVSDVMDDARQRLNDIAKDIYADDNSDATKFNLPSFVADAWGELEDEYAKRDINLLEKLVSSFSYTADAETISIPMGITDLQEPLEIYQRLTSADAWKLVPRRTELPAPWVQEPQYLGWWEWSENTIKVNPATSSLDLLVRYRRLLDYPDKDTAMTFENLYWPLVWGTVYLACIPSERASLIAAAQSRYMKRLMDSILIESRRTQADVASFGRWSGNPRGTPIFKTR